MKACQIRVLNSQKLQVQALQLGSLVDRAYLLMDIATVNNIFITVPPLEIAHLSFTCLFILSLSVFIVVAVSHIHKLFVQI
jgi:hypothetical protein